MDSPKTVEFRYLKQLLKLRDGKLINIELQQINMVTRVSIESLGIVKINHIRRKKTQ